MPRHSKDLCVCGKLKDKRANFCRVCSNLGEHNPNWKNGITRRKYYCISCKINEISYTTFYYGNKTCQSCATKGKNNASYIDGRWIKKYYCKELECNKEITYQTWKYGKGRCRFCATKLNVKTRRSYEGKNNPMYGKVVHGKWGIYKKINMRSGWEIGYAKYLDSDRIRWFYEPKTFDLGKTSYIPDFYLPKTNTYIEIKGYWRDDAKKKFELFKIKYPRVKIRVLMKPDLVKLGIL